MIKDIFVSINYKYLMDKMQSVIVKKMKMKKILVPTDFSDNANNALTYASELNKKINAEIMLFHVYTIPVIATDIPVFVLTEGEVQADAEFKLDKLKQEYKALYPAIEFKTKASMGLAKSGIIDEEKEARYDLVVMGTRGASGMSGFFVGSYTASVIGKSVCPVIAVPENARMTGLNKIVFAANYGTDDFENVFEVIEIARLFDSEVILLHVATGELNKTFEFAEIEGFKEQISGESGYDKISFRLLEDVDVYHGLNFYLEEIKADMLIINMRNRTFAQKFASGSLTKKMAYHTHIPLLAFHTDI